MSIARKATQGAGRNLIAEYTHGDSLTPWVARNGGTYYRVNGTRSSPYDTNHVRIYSSTGGSAVTPWATHGFSAVNGKTYHFIWEAASCESGQSTRAQLSTLIATAGAADLGQIGAVIGNTGGTSEATWLNTVGTQTLYFFVQTHAKQNTPNEAGSVGIWNLKIYELN